MSNEALRQTANDQNVRKPTTSADITSEIFDGGRPVNFVPLDMNVYSPTRLDYFAARALQGLIAGRSEKDIRKTPKQAVALAKELVELLD